MLGNARARERIAFAGGANEPVPVEDGDPLASAVDQLRALQRVNAICDRGALHAEHFRQQILRQQHGVVVSPVPHHQQPARQPLREIVRAVAASGDHHLLEEGVHVALHQTAEGGDGLHGMQKRRARHFCGRARKLDEKPRRGCLGSEHGLESGRAFPADGGHFDDRAVRIDRYHRDHAAIRKVDVVEHAIRIQQHLLALALDRLEARENLSANAARQCQEESVLGPVGKHGHALFGSGLDGVLWTACDLPSQCRIPNGQEGSRCKRVADLAGNPRATNKIRFRTICCDGACRP